jgi:hypothetical protein
MRQFLLLAATSLLFFCGAYAQSVPQGMNYQAVARDISGNVLANQQISLKITLLSNGSTVHYSEVHTVTTNQLGLFTLIIGQGKPDQGTFNEIPWSTKDIWMQIAIKDKGSSDFSVISNSKLLAVPYAFHAGTASELVANKDVNGSSQHPELNVPNVVNGVAPGSGTTSSNGNSWNVGGNLGTTPPVHYVGTADYNDLVVKTNAQIRFIFQKDGNDTLLRSLSIGANLNTDSSVNLNRTNGSTLNNGPFTVGTLTRRSPTFLFGTLTVDSSQSTTLGGTLSVDKETQLNSSLTVAGMTNLNSSLYVNNKSATLLTGTLRVKGISDLDSSLNVNSKSPTRLTGTLTVDSNAVFNSPTNSDTTLESPNGALAIYGGVGILKNLTIGGDVRIGGKTTFAGPLRITDPTQSDNVSTGAVTVSGGVGIAKNLNIGGDASIIGNTIIGGSTTVAGVTTINNVLNVNAGTGQVSIVGATGGGGDGSSGSYPLVVSGNSQGVMVKITGTTQASSANNFLTFQDGSAIRGRIEGQTQADLENEERYQSDVLHLEIAIAAAVGSEIKDGATLIGALTATTPCVGLGVCETVPPVSPIVAATANLIVSTAKLAEAVAGLVTYKDTRSANLGVTYASKGADYAEWLPKLNKQDHLVAGEVVGMKDGFISRSTRNADKIMVISTNPIVLGNMGNAQGSEKVAFMGQVPVRVFGKVELGDYIIASGEDNGFGIARHAQDLTATDYLHVVGIAWSASQNNVANLINVAVGLGSGDANILLQKQEEKIAVLSSELNDLKAQVNKTNEVLSQLVSGKKTSIASSQLPVSLPVIVTSTQVNSVAVSSSSASSNDGNNRWIYNKLTDSEIEEGLKLAQQMLSDKGVNVNKDPFFNKLRTDAGYKATFMAKFKDNYNTNVERIKKADKTVITK